MIPCSEVKFTAELPSLSKFPILLNKMCPCHLSGFRELDLKTKETNGRNATLLTEHMTWQKLLWIIDGYSLMHGEGKSREL